MPVRKVTLYSPPNRITDLVGLKKEGAEIVCRPSFEILPVDFTHRDHQFQAHIFLCRYSGMVDGRPYSFRKCYARGCPYNLCPHVSQAVMIANRYLQRDLRTLRSGGIKLENRLFSLDDMVVKFEKLHESQGPVLIIHDYINIAREGNDVSIEIELEYVSAVEHFAHHDHAQTFLMGNFVVATLGQVHPCQRCFACYATEDRNKEKPLAVEVANARLEVLYGEFEQAAIRYQRRFFE
jgi:hypothetical protein